MGLIRNYVPIIKTTDAEIKGYKNLSSDIKEKITPLFELTRSRPLKNYPAGDVEKRMREIIEHAEGNPFLLDLTSHEDLSNDQIIDLQDDINGFQMWRSFLKRYKDDASIIPLLHLYDDNLRTYKECASKLLVDFPKVAFRVSCAQKPSDLHRYLTEIRDVVELSEQYHLAIDAGFITHSNIALISSKCNHLLEVAQAFGVISISVHSSSFPASVVAHSQGCDDEGDMDLLELDFFAAVSSTDRPVTYGDYAGIHPIRRAIGGGTWVPRVDLTIDDAYIYKRYRREEGSYALAAKELVKSARYNPVECWGKDQIEKAAGGSPPGKSPAFWISVRLNQHITRLAMMLT